MRLKAINYFLDLLNYMLIKNITSDQLKTIKKDESNT